MKKQNRSLKTNINPNFLITKHLAPYLPFGLKVAQARLGGIAVYSMYGLKIGLNNDLAYIDDKDHGDYQCSYLPGISPILSSLFDLDLDSISSVGKELILNNGNLSDLPYGDATLLFAGHFDVFGLIESGVAKQLSEIHTL